MLPATHLLLPPKRRLIDHGAMVVSLGKNLQLTRRGRQQQTQDDSTRREMFQYMASFKMSVLTCSFLQASKTRNQQLVHHVVGKILAVQQLVLHVQLVHSASVHQLVAKQQLRRGQQCSKLQWQQPVRFHQLHQQQHLCQFHFNFISISVFL